MKKIFLVPVFVILQLQCSAQINKFRAGVVAFYNLENFYDTTNNPLVNDDDFTPNGIKKYTSEIYEDKINKLAFVLSRIGKELVKDGPMLIGVAEIENDTVLTDLIHHQSLKENHYRIIHFDSKDPRGIDVGLLYNPKYFLPQKAEKIFVQLPGNSKEAFFTRDILYVKGFLSGEIIHIYVNHWPSRRGGEERSSSAREAAALACKKHINGILLTDPQAKIIIMGDLNDDPDSPSVTDVLKAKGNKEGLKADELFNPWLSIYQNGIGTLANRDRWGLFDQIILSQAWLQKDQDGLFFHQAFIYQENCMKEQTGRYKGYPMRTWDGNNYRGGYSDHFPTYIVLAKSIR